MKLAAIADLHVDINKSYPVLECLAGYLKDEGADGVLIAGDISEDVLKTCTSAADLKRLAGIPVWYVPGNHDMWSGDFHILSTDQIYRTFEKDPNCLSNKGCLLKGRRETYALIGDIGWYDYSFSSPQYDEKQLDAMELEGRIWQDRLKNQWTSDNRGCLRRSLERLEAQLVRYREYPAIVVTHMLPVREFCVPGDRAPWDYFNGFLGSEALGELLSRYRVKYAVCGHVHYRKRMRSHVPGGAGQGKAEAAGRYMTCICPCLGYHSEWKHTGVHSGDLRWQIEHAVQWIAI